jgi:hypothetical protein
MNRRVYVDLIVNLDTGVRTARCDELNLLGIGRTLTSAKNKPGQAIVAVLDCGLVRFGYDGDGYAFADLEEAA